MRDKGGVDAATLAKHFGIGIEAAKRTRIVTTQRGARKMIHPSLNKRYKTNDRQLRYRRFPVTLFTDTMYSTILSRQMNKAAQVFCDCSRWGRALSMKKQKEAHAALSLLFHRDDVSNVMGMEDTKAQVQGEFRRKLRDAGCHIRQTEPHTQSSNMCEGGVRELHRGVGRQMMRSGCPKRLLDECLVREAYVRSNTALEIFGLEGQVPDSRMKCETTDISTIVEYGWYEWVKFQDTAASFTVSKIQLGRDLVAAIDIGPAMSRKILKANGQVLYRTSIRSLTPDEIQSPDEIVERLKFDISVEEKLGKSMLAADFKNDPYFSDFVTPTFEHYEDDEVPASKMPDIDDVENNHNVDTYDQYFCAQVRVPIGGEIRSGKVMRRKRELDGTWKGRANVNSMMDPRTYRWTQ
jgi:hypothetical protein